MRIALALLLFGLALPVRAADTLTPQPVKTKQRTDVQVQVTDGTDIVGVTDVGGQKALKVDVVQTAGAGGTSSAFGAPIPANGTAAGYSDGTNMQLGRVFDLDTAGTVEYVLGQIGRAHV